MARKRKHRGAPGMNLPLTAMIDVVFQLLIYLIVTAKPKDVITNLDVFRPAPDAKAAPSQKMPNMIRINVFPNGYMMNDREVGPKELDRMMAKMAGLDKNQTVLITCGSLSLHDSLVRVLDICKRHGMTSLSVVSGN